jgi:Ca2+-binding RTX toxin-like protein
VQGRIVAGIGVLGAAVAACCLVPSISDGAESRRGGNHGCNPVTGVYYENDFWPAGDKVVFGFRFEPGMFMDPDRDVIGSQNVSADDESDSTGLICSGDVGDWDTLESFLGPGDDSVRFDAKGLPAGMGEEPFERIPNTMSTNVKTGGGADKIRGHKGFDNIRAGAGDDVIKADDGKADNVNCGTGRDKADVDSKDDLKSCEKLS